MRVFLAITLDKAGSIRKDLYETTSLEEMDRFMQKYKSSYDVREEFKEEITKFLSDHKWYFNNLELKALNEGRNPRKNFGRITVCFYGKGNKLHFVPAVYKDYQLIKRVNMKELEDRLSEDKVFRRLVKERTYLFGTSQYAYDTISLYQRLGYPKYKKMLLELLIERFKSSSKEHKYYYLRALSGIGHLIEPVRIKTKYGEIGNVDIPKEEVTLVRDRISDSCVDDFFISLCENGDYEELFKYYDVDKVLKYSKDENNPLGLRR